ncbi:MAG: DUF2914 domain-containing protein [Deltaproteobacteria bacterium]|jgi:hypothetical protein
MKAIFLPILALCFFLIPLTTFAQETGAVSDAGPIHLEVIAVCRNVVDRTPVSIDSVFPTNVGRLYCFTKVVGAQKETQVTHNWFKNGKLQSSITLPVKSSSWRTWSLKEIRASDAGDWMVEVLGEDGNPLEAILFFIK